MFSTDDFLRVIPLFPTPLSSDVVFPPCDISLTCLRSALVSLLRRLLPLTRVSPSPSPGVVSSSIANPTDVLKVRMQAANDSVRQKGMLRCFADIYEQEGVRGLWRVSSRRG